jgi:hypothetical protein
MEGFSLNNSYGFFASNPYLCRLNFGILAFLSQIPAAK